MRQITDIVIHCADTPTGRKTTVEDIDSWHKQRGFTRDAKAQAKLNPQLSAIGYHYVIYIDGSLHSGRGLDEVGAHCIPNGKSIGICMAGNGKYNYLQWSTLRMLVDHLLEQFPDASVTGHYQWPSAQKQGKTCPNFDVPAWLANDKKPAEANIAEVKR